MIATQTAVGEAGRKAVTELSWSFCSLINAGGLQYGCNEFGIYLLNADEDDDLVAYERSFTLATTDLGVRSTKRARFIDIGFEANEGDDFKLIVTVDSQDPREYDVVPLKSGLQKVRVTLGIDGQGRYWKFKISSTHKFRIDQIDGTFIVRSRGIKG